MFAFLCKNILIWGCSESPSSFTSSPMISAGATQQETCCRLTSVSFMAGLYRQPTVLEVQQLWQARFIFVFDTCGSQGSVFCASSKRGSYLGIFKALTGLTDNVWIMFPLVFFSCFLTIFAGLFTFLCKTREILTITYRQGLPIRSAKFCQVKLAK